MCEKCEEYEARIQELEGELSNAKSIITKIEGESILLRKENEELKKKTTYRVRVKTK